MRFPLIAALVLALVPLGAEATARLPNFAQGTPYVTVRAQLMRMGYDPAPVRRKPGFSYSGCLASDEFCRAFPETLFCGTRDFVRICGHLFRRRSDGRLVVVRSKGEEDGSRHPVDLTVVTYESIRPPEPGEFHGMMVIANPSRKGPR